MDKHLLLQLFIALFLAHLLADFVFQPNKMARRKTKWQWRALHSVIHVLLTYALLAKWGLWYIPLFIGVSHYLVDWGKNTIKRQDLPIFVLDQGVHLLILVGASLWIYSIFPSVPGWQIWLAPYLWNLAIIICSVILLLPAGGILIGYIMDPIQQQIEMPAKGLENGGKLIGYLERLLILTFVMTNQFVGIGFLVAAKSIFRFSEIKDSNNRKEAEYIIIGTFSSFLYAIIVSLLAAKGLLK